MLVKELGKESKIVTLESTNNINRSINVRDFYFFKAVMNAHQRKLKRKNLIKHEHCFKAR